MSKLKRELRQVDVWGLAFGAIIGTGCFFLPGTRFLPQSGPLGMVIGISIGMIMVMVVGINYSYMIQKHPKAGGEYIFVKENMNEKHAYICGWFLILAYMALIPLNGTAATMILRYLVPGLLERGKLYTIAGWDVYLAEIAVTSVVIIILTIINVTGVKVTGFVQTVIAFTLIGSVFFLGGIFAVKGVEITNLQPYFNSSAPKINCVLSTLAIAPFLFIGFDCIPQASEEYKFSNKKTIKIMFLAIILATVVYCSVNLLTAIVMPWEELIASDTTWATGFAVQSKTGKWGILLLGTAMTCAALSGINAFLLSSSRLLYSMAEDNVISGKFAEIDGKRRIPKKAILFIACVSLIAPWFGREVLNWIVDMTSVGGALAYAYTSFITFRIAKREKRKNYMISGILGTVFSICFLFLLLWPSMPGALGVQSYICLVIWTVLGIVFAFTGRKTVKKQ